jgi:hypothetical protein
MFHCSIYLGGGKTRRLSSNQWDHLREQVALALKKYPGCKWGALRDDEGLYVGRFRRSMHTYPKNQPSKYLPDQDLFTRPPK